MLLLLFVALSIFACSCTNSADFIEDNSGNVTITAGTTLITVNTTLGAVPTNVQLTLLGNPGDNVTIDVESLRSNSFDIRFQTPLTVDERIFWVARRKP